MQRRPKASQPTSPDRAAARILSLSPLRPSLGMVLGSGFSDVLEAFEVAGRIRYCDVPGFPPAGVAGHAGEVLVGRLGGTPVVVLRGRAHYYEGHDLEAVTFGVRTLAACGVRDLLLTNAAGGIGRAFKAGDFMLIADHINLMGANPLRGPLSGRLTGFVDMTHAYDATLSALLRRAARRSRMKLPAGVYLAVSGPSYETPAEIRAFSRLGADAVGMSTVPETIVARQLGMRVAAVSCITNLAAGRGRHPLLHDQVLETAGRSKHLAARLLRAFAALHGRMRMTGAARIPAARRKSR